MKLFKKFSTYLLENHPLLWHTRSIQLTVLAFLLWIIAFVSGYSMTDLEVLRVFSINRYYEKSGFYLFHIAIVIIVLAIWAFLFFKNNAFKAIYPIGRLYFQKTLLLLFIPFTLLTSLYIPFTKGLHVKTRGILSKEQLLTDFQTITLASAFLPVDGSNYSIGNKCYPGPFPLKRITFNKGTKKWSDEYLNIMVPSNKSERVKHRDYSYSDSNTTIVESRKMQFFRDTSYAIETCHWATAISKIYKIDTNVIHLELNSIWNYSNSDFIELYSSFKVVANITNYRKTHAPEVHRISESKDWESISKIIDKAKFSLSRYGIDYHIDNKSIIRYLKEKNFRDLSKIINNYPFESAELRNRLDNEQMTFQDYENLSFIEKQEFFPLHHINLNALQTVYKNYSSACSSLLERNFLFLFFFLGFGLAFIAVYFQIVKPIPFLLSIPVWGVLFILLGLFNLIFPRRYYDHNYFDNNGVYLLTQFFILFVVVQIINLILWKFFKKGKSLFNITTAMAIVGSSFVLPLLLQIIHIRGTYELDNECGNTMQIEPLGGFFDTPPAVFWAAAIGIMLSLFLARIWIAKKE